MLKNFLKITFRKLFRNKGTSAINILGLTIGMASAMLILIWIKSEVSTDRFHKNIDRLYWVYNRNKVNGDVYAINQTPAVLATTLKHDYPEVESVMRFNNVTFLLSVGEKHLNVRGAFADSSCFTMFTFPLIKGNVVTALNDPSGIVITKDLAKRLFGNEDAYGKTVRIDSNANFKVTGVLDDLPRNSIFSFEYLLPWSFMSQLGWEDHNWTNNFAFTWVLLKPGASQAAFDSKIKNIIIDHTKDAPYQSTAEVFTQPLTRAYLYARAENGKLVGGRIEMVRLFSMIAAFTLLIACINFMNLSTARSEKRAKEVGIRKVSGAHRGNLIAQFIGESILLSFIAFGVAVVLVQLCLPAFNLLIDGRTLSIDYADPVFGLTSLGFVLTTGLIAGSYPAVYLSSFKPVNVLKGTFKKTGALITPRKVLVVMQFSFAIILIISTIIVQKQIEYGRERDLGYNKNNLVYTFAQGEVDKHYELIRDELIKSGAAVSVTRSSGPITERWNSSSGYEWTGSTAADNRTEFINLGSDADLSKTAGLKILQGRDIDVYKYPSDTLALLLNEAAVKAMRLKNPVGQIIRRINYPEQWHVVGVVKDFILESPFEATINPMIIRGPLNFFYIIHFKLDPANSTAAGIAKAEAIFKKYNPQYPFEYYFADEQYDRRFREISRTGKLSFLFAGLTIFISCLGLFGLASYMAENRTKEIGVRKVLGASVTSITTLLSKDFLKLIVISFLIAAPVAWYIMNAWLQNYTYRVNISWWVFAGAGILSVLIAILTISFQAIKAAVANPVKSLRTE
ncbi:MAG TPA: ABC transporter permease [Puia sp.]|jgi:putative ABC transport system permease protein|nr:ABC transporter permease [Puia sp.]